MKKLISILVSMGLLLFLLTSTFAITSKENLTPEEQYTNKLSQLNEIQTQLDGLTKDYTKIQEQCEASNKEIQDKQDIYNKAKDTNDRAEQNADLLEAEQLKKVKQDYENAKQDLETGQDNSSKLQNEKKATEEKLDTLKAQKIEQENELLMLKAKLLETGLSQPIWVEGYGEIPLDDSKTPDECSKQAIEAAKNDALQKSRQLMIDNFAKVDQFKLLNETIKVLKVQEIEEDQSKEYNNPQRVTKGEIISYTAKVKIKVRSVIISNPYKDAIAKINDANAKVIIGVYKDPNFNFYIVNPDGTNVRKLAENIISKLVTWSPDGSKIILYSDQDDLVIDIDGAKETTKIKGLELSWSPDSKKILFTAKDKISAPYCHICTINADGTELKELTSKQRQFVYGPSWSPDGTKINYYSLGKAGENMMIMNADGSNNQAVFSVILQEMQYYHWLGWSQDSKKIVYDLKSYIYSIDANGTNQKQLAKGNSLALLPSGNKILYEFNDAIYTVNMDGTNLKKLVTGQFLSLSPNKNQILYKCKDYICVVNSDGANSKQLVGYKDFYLDFNGTKQLAEGREPLWSPDSTKIFFCDDRCNLGIINADGTNIVYLFNVDVESGFYDGSWSPDGSKITIKIYSKAGTPAGVYFLDSGGEHIFRLNMDDIPGWSPGWGKLVSDFRIINVDGWGVINIDCGEKGEFAVSSWSPATIELGNNF